MTAAQFARPTEEHGVRNATVMLAAILLSVMFLLASSGDRAGQASSTRLPQGAASQARQTDAERQAPMPEPGLAR